MVGSVSNKTIQRIERIEGSSASEALHRLYHIELLSYSDLIKRWNMGSHTVIKLMKHFNIKPRDLSEAVKTQWIGDNDRRDKTSKIMSDTVKRMNNSGISPRLGKTKETSEKVRNASEKLKLSTSARRPEVRKKMSQAKILAYNNNPLQHPNANVMPTECEKTVINSLKENGIETIHNFRIGRYWIDIFIPDMNLGIECTGSSTRAYSWKRHKAITDTGATIIYIENRQIKRGNLWDLHKYVTNFKSIRSRPSFKSQDTVVWGHRILEPFASQPDNVTVVRTDMGKCYKLIISAATNNGITLF